jgi:acyl-ACP thioesterase
LVQVLILACLVARPEHCERFEVLFAEPVSEIQCQFVSQLRVAQWQGEHPAWSVRSWRCEFPEI